VRRNLCIFEVFFWQGSHFRLILRLKTGEASRRTGSNGEEEEESVHQVGL